MSRLRGLLSPLSLLAATLVTAPAVAATAAVTTSDTPQAAAPAAYTWRFPLPQVIRPGTLLVAKAHHRSAGTRSDQQFFKISTTGDNDVPSAALSAYKKAAATLAKEQPSCHLPWALLAAIGRVESNHGRFGGAQLGSDGVSRPAIVGPQLDGSGDFAAIPDSDHGVLDGDRSWDRAVGQMQFLPSTWRAVGRDGDGDGKADPDDIDDSALAAAGYLCGSGGDLSTVPGASAAAFRYNHSDYYVQLVLSFEQGYQTGVFAIPSPPPAPKPRTPVRHTVHHPVATKAAHHVQHPAAASTLPSPTPQPTPKTTPKPAPKPTGKPSPKPTPAAPLVRLLNGTLLASDQDYTLGGIPLSFPGQYTDTAKADFDGDGTVETNRAELDGLVALGTPVAVHGSLLGGILTVDQIRGLDY